MAGNILAIIPVSIFYSSFKKYNPPEQIIIDKANKNDFDRPVLREVLTIIDIKITKAENAEAKNI